MRFYAGATRSEILSAMDITQTTPFLKREEEIEGVRGEVGVFEPVLLTKQEIKTPVVCNDEHPKCDGDGIHVPHQLVPTKFGDEHQLQH